MPQISVDEIDRIVAGHHHDPHSILGAHPGPDGITVRALRPLAAAVTVVLSDGRRFPMRHFHEGVFEAILPPGDMPDYRLAVTYPTAGGESAFAADPETLTDDPYRHLPTLGEMDMYLIQEGRHEQLWKVLGAHVRTLPGKPAAGGAAPGKTGATTRRPPAAGHPTAGRGKARRQERPAPPRRPPASATSDEPDAGSARRRARPAPPRRCRSPGRHPTLRYGKLPRRKVRRPTVRRRMGRAPRSGHRCRAVIARKRADSGR